MAFHDDLLRHLDAVKARVPHIRGEEATKHSLVVPLLQVLGYDVFDPREVQPEYIADFAKKRSNGQMEKIDYAIWLNGSPAIFIECKALDAKLEDHDGQLARYFNATPNVKVAILTNGVPVRVYSDLQQPNIMDSAPWLDVELLAAKPAEIEALKRFRKPDFVPEQVVALAEEMVFYSAMVSLLSTQLREPSESFVRWVAGEIPAVNRITAKVVERLSPILRKALQAAILENVARSFEPPAPPQEAAAVSSPAESSSPDSKEGITTTSEEIQCFDYASGWVREVHPDAVIAFRDSKTYASLHQNNVRKWYLRFNVQRPPFWVAFRHLPADELKKLAPGFEILEPSGFGDSRVALKGLADWSKLRAAVIAAHEKEAARVVDDGQPAPAP